MRHLTLFLVFLALLLAGCNEAAIPRGSAQDQAASLTARSTTSTAAADAAVVDAAKASATAAELEHQAVADPTPAKIAAAADARVAAASAQAVSDALAKVAAKAQTDATAAAILARQERAADAKDEDQRNWMATCRWIGLLGLLAGGVLGCLLGYFSGPSVGIPVGGSIALLGLLVVAYGQTITWLPVALGAAVLVGLGAWAVTHYRHLQVTTALSKTVDALQGTSATTVKDAKGELATAVAKSGLTGFFDRVRATWAKVI